ncbi:hypothetical protein TorRG33x02_266470 [Trema orientale]|uniref:Uncharacterized protein n=1 Tax=Trema orientale TaxID=63057 RepID=A0A2P5D0Y1_TREOI|nr:hypothetical protein TorRG33x02_266470 [Trema orientale]
MFFVSYISELLQGGEEKDTNDDDFVTQVDASKKVEGEKIAAIERPKRVIKPVDKFTPIEKKKTIWNTVQKTTVKKLKTLEELKKQKTMAKQFEKSDPN